MEAIVAWFICLSLQFLELCNCYPVTSLTDDASKGIVLTSTLSTILSVAVILAVFLLLVGCTWCTRVFRKDAHLSQTIQLGDTGSSEVVDPGILNPLNDVRFPITTPINRISASPRIPNVNQQDEIEGVLHVPFYPRDNEDADNNNMFEDNNNGPISPQELENIVNNNAENYIVTEYENRNLNREAQGEVLDEIQDAPPGPSSSHTSPRHNVWNEHSDWFYVSGDEVSRTQLQYLQVIGKGWFGRIVEGELHGVEGHGSPSHGAVTKVAVKILDENVSITEKCNFLRESQMLRDAKHCNILKFMGKNLSQDPWFILFECCCLGDLKQYLIRNKSQMQYFNDEGMPLKFILEVSSALEYLHQKNIFYDLACHNCLVSDNLSIRLGDYGDAEQRYPEHFYPLRETKPAPIRWLPPEYVVSPQGNCKGNIWSLGVFMWECCSWGDLPYEHLSNEQVIQDVLCLNGVRLNEPVPNTQYTSYLYNVMLTCWNDDPNLRCNISHVLQYMQSLYANFYHSTDKSFSQNFDARWETFKPNSIPKVDNSLPQNALQSENFYLSDIVIEPDVRILHPGDGLACQSEAVSSDTLSVDEHSIKIKSDSLTNLHGSFESVSNHENMRNLPEKYSPFNTSDEMKTSNENTSDVSVEKSLLESGVSQVAPWLLNVPFNTPEDFSYIKNVSDVINDFDNMLSSEKTSSSESSPSRVVVTSMSCSNTQEYNSQLALSEGSDKVDLNDSITELNDSCFKEHQSQNSEPIDKNVPEISKDINYPTLDFRLNDLDEEKNPIFESNMFVNESPELDSLQDSSYIPNVNKDSSSQKQSTSGSETEDEVWKKRVELGMITEKIKMKSKSVTDFMVLTHIELDNTDLESEAASYNSLEGKSNAFLEVVQRRLKRNSSQFDALTGDEFSSFPRNFSSSILNQNMSLKPELDLYRLWKNCKHITLRSLRASKSLSDLDELRTRIVPFEDLMNFKLRMDSFLEFSFDKGNKSNHTDSTKCHQFEQRHFDLAHPFVGQIPNSIFSQTHLNNYSLLSGAAEEENLNFSSNFNDINLNLYSVDHSSSIIDQTVGDQWESTKYMSPPDAFPIQSKTNGRNVPDEEQIDYYDSRIMAEVPNTSFNIENNVGNTSTPTFIDNNISNKEIIIPQVSISEATSNNISANNENINSLVERQVDEIIRNELLNITTKLAIAENENNLNIEFSSPSSLTDQLQNFNELHDDFEQSDVRESVNVDVQIPNVLVNCIADNMNIDSTNIFDLSTNAHCEDRGDLKLITDLTDGLADTVEVTNVVLKEKIISNQLIQDLDDELEKLDAECEAAEASYFSPETSESSYENVNPRDKKDKTSSTGWYLHPKVENEEGVTAQLNAFPVNLPNSNSSSVESLTENNSDHYIVDPESVEALRSELQLKLPLAQRVSQMHHDNLGNGNSNDSRDSTNAEQLLPMCKPSMRDSNLVKHNMSEASTSTGVSSSDISIPSQSQGKNEVLIHYSVYGIVPLSPIQEESWSEFSEMEKAADINKTDSNSISLGEETSNIEQILPFDGVCDMKIMDAPSKLQTHPKEDEDSYSDSSNRTFVLNDGGPSNLKKQHSLSADSLNSIEQFDIDDEEDVCIKKQIETKMEVPQLKVNSSSEMFSPICDEHSHPKSTEEISQNVDNLLETISKTLENASKICTLGSGGQNEVELIDAEEDKSETSGSKTYVIENNVNALQNFKAVYNDKVAEIPDDVSNVSKVSQPSLVSDITSPDESDMKVSEKSASMHSHTKTPSMESWCSNDTLFNVEENLDDVCVGDFTSPINKFGALSEEIPGCSGTPQKIVQFELPQMEMVMGYLENLNNQTYHENCDILPSIQPFNKSPPDKLESTKHFPLLIPEPLMEKHHEGHDKSIAEGKLKSPEGIVDLDAMIPIPPDRIENGIENQKPNESRPEISINQSADTTNHISSLNSPPTLYNSNFNSQQINMTSTPTSSTEESSTVKHSTENVIDEHFKFLENISAVSADDNSSLILNATNSFLKNEQKFALSVLDKSCVILLNNSILKKLEGSDSNIEIAITDIPVNINTESISVQEIVDDPSKICGGISTDSIVAENKFILEQINQTDKDSNNDLVIENSNIESSNNSAREIASHINTSMKSSSLPHDLNTAMRPDVLSSTQNDENEDIETSNIPVKPLDATCPSLLEYMEYSGLNMGANNLDVVSTTDSSSFEAFKLTAASLPQDLANCTDDVDSYDTLQDLCSPGLRNIQFSGPSNEDNNTTQPNEIDISPILNAAVPLIDNNVTPILNTTDFSSKDNITPLLNATAPSSQDNTTQSFNATTITNESGNEHSGNNFQDAFEIGHMAPERLKDWDSESDDSNCSSTSSAEFVWKEGDGVQLLNVPSVSYPSSSTMKHQASFHGASQSFAGIPEEEEDARSDQHDAGRGDEDEDDEDEEEMDFVPSSWDCHAAPSKSALKSPDTSQIENRKRVVFKKQKYQSIYEYPRDDEAFQTLPDFSTYAEWTAASGNAYMPVDYQHFLQSTTSEPPAFSGSGCEDDFFISSSSRPFETYSTVNSSEFFPGQQFSLLSNHYDYGALVDNNEEEDFKSLPPIPTEEELRNALGSDAPIDSLEKPPAKSSDYVTPDSGTEDTSPGDLLDFENILNNKNVSVPNEPVPVGSVDEGLDHDIENVPQNKPVELSESTQSPSSGTGTTTLLGGLRHTRDKLKLDLPASPLPRNSPCLVNSGKNSNKDTVIFDFKNVSQLECNEGEEVSQQIVTKPGDKVLDNEGQKDKEKCLSSLESDTCDSEVISPNSVISVIGKFDVNNQQVLPSQDTEASSSPPADGVLHKSVIRMQDKARRVSLEPVKGEGTLLDSGDEDSGIGSSAYATLERKCDNLQLQIALDKNPSNKPT